MSKLSISVKTLVSRKIRTGFISGKTGKSILEGGSESLRKINNQLKFQKNQIRERGLVDWIVGGLSSAVGFVVSKAVGFLGWSFSAAFGWMVDTAMTISTIDWNATDEEMLKLIESYETSTASGWGSFVGQSLGWFAGIAIGVGVSFTLPVIGGAALARRILTTSGKEALEELYGSLQGALKNQLRNNTSILLIRQYLAIRNSARDAAKNGWLPGDVKQRVEKWGVKGASRFVIGEKIEEKIERIPDKRIRAFVSNAVDEFFDSFIESGYVVAFELDNAYAQARRANVNQLGEGRAVSIKLNKNARSGDQELMKIPELPQTLMKQEIIRSVNQYRMMANRDIGLVVGLPLDEYVRAKEQSLRIVIDLYDRQYPPFRRASNQTHVTITIPNARLSAIDWDVIKAACGGKNGYLWGKYRASATLDSKRRLIVHASTPKGAEERLKAYLNLSNDNLDSLNITEETNEGQRKTRTRLRKETTRVYPAYVTIINRKELLDPNDGRSSLKYNYRDVTCRFPLWTEREPFDFKERVASVLRRGF